MASSGTWSLALCWLALLFPLGLLYPKALGSLTFTSCPSFSQAEGRVFAPTVQIHVPGIVWWPTPVKCLRMDLFLRLGVACPESLSLSLSCARLFATPWTENPHPWDFLGKSTGVGCRFLLQGIFPTQASNPGLPHCRQTLPSEPLVEPVIYRNVIYFQLTAQRR